MLLFFYSIIGKAGPEVSSHAASQGKDLLSLIVDRGIKLREAMVISSLPGDAQNASSK